jgi:D-hexose-6-phosphate mutarotase
MLEQLNQQFGKQQLQFVTGPNDLIVAEIRNNVATAQIALYGGHILAYARHNQPAILWMSQKAVFQPGKAIRGGIPICWPWFANHPTDPSKPAHGFVRIMPWNMRSSTAIDATTTQIVLGISDTPATHELWPHAFDLELNVTVGQTLTAALTMRNTDSEPWSITGALHSYFTVGQIAAIQITGVEGSDYLDKVDQMRRKTQVGPVSIAGEHEFNPIYIDTTATCVIHDPVLQRQISVAKQGSQTTVIWNPGRDKTPKFSDLAATEYQTMVCIETGNVIDDVIQLDPGASHTLATIIE